MNMQMELDRLFERLKPILPDTETVPLHEPCFIGDEWSLVKDCLDSGWVSSVGSYVDGFEQALVEYTGAGFAVAVVNGTAALHICLQLCGVQAGDEVLVPALTFVATANAIAYCGAAPHFVDCETSTLGVDPDKLESYLQQMLIPGEGAPVNRMTGRPVRALVVVHAFGHPARLDELSRICQRFNIGLVEDAAESLGSLYKGEHTGNRGVMSAVSFNGNKIITTGGGGAILTNSETLAHQARHITTTAKVSHPWEIAHDRVGYNYRMPNINAALGCAQLQQLDFFVTSKRALAAIYQRELADLEGIEVYHEPPYARSNYWLNLLVLKDDYKQHRDDIMQAGHERGVMLRPAWTPLHQLQPYNGSPRMALDATQDLVDSLICLPSSVHLVRNADK